MGGFGSGRPGWKLKTWEFLRLEVLKLHKGGALEAGRVGHIGWDKGGGEKSTVSFRASGDYLSLDYRVRIGGGEWEAATQTIRLERTPCRFGGERPWFLCPGCGRRAGVLYGLRLFLCRTCQRLAYASQSEARYDRLLRRANKLRARLGGEAGMSAMISKPKHMRWETFDRIQDEIHNLENEGLALAMLRFGMLF